MDHYQQLREFHVTYDVPLSSTPALLTDRLELRLNLIREEVQELEDAAAAGDLIEQIDALGDIVYVCYGMALEMGVNLHDVVTEIHRSNMSKLGADGKPIYRDDGKVLKGPNYFRPDIRRIVFG